MTVSATSHSPAAATVATARGIWWFLALAFVPAWALWFVAWEFGYGLDNAVIQLATGAFLPAAAAFIVRRWITREGFADCGLGLRLRRAWRWYLTALLLPPALLLVAVPVGLASGTALMPSGGGWMLPLALAPLLVVLTAPIYFGEEFGWTAYLRLRLGTTSWLRNRPQLASALTGAVWGIWHWPLALVGYFGYAPPLRDVLASMVLWVVLSMLLEVVWTWLWFGSGTIWVTSIAHAGFNLVFSLTMDQLLDPRGMMTGFVLSSIALVPLVIGVLWWSRSFRDPGSGTVLPDRAAKA